MTTYKKRLFPFTYEIKDSINVCSFVREFAINIWNYRVASPLKTYLFAKYVKSRRRNYLAFNSVFKLTFKFTVLEREKYKIISNLSIK